MLRCPSNRKFDESLALKNYRSIIRLVHPDKNPDPRAHIATSCLVRMWEFIREQPQREAYEQLGRVALVGQFERKELKEVVEYLETLPLFRERLRGNSDGEGDEEDEEEDEEENDGDEEEGEFNREPRGTYRGNQRKSRKATKPMEPIRVILDHRMRGDTIRFRVVWDSFELDNGMWESKEEVLESSPITLKGYLDKLKSTRPVSFKTIIKKIPDLASLYFEVNKI